MTASRFLPRERRLGDQPGRLDEILFLCRTDREPLLDLQETRERRTQSLGGSCDPCVVPHYGAYRISAHLRRASIGQHRYSPIRYCGLGSEWSDGREIAGDTLGEYEAFQQRVRCEPVRAVDAGPRDLANRV
jgi:hypothetical protein